MTTAQQLTRLRRKQIRIAAAIKCEGWRVTWTEYAYIFADGSQLVFGNQDSSITVK